MSKVQLAGNANGTGIFTIASPNSNTDRTINLPDATGTVQVSGNPISGTTGTFTGLLNISASGAGQIQFPASQNASANANTLDDYEEGSGIFSSVQKDGAGASVALATNEYYYTKIGRFVYLAFRVQISTPTVSTYWRLNGLPFTNFNADSAVGISLNQFNGMVGKVYGQSSFIDVNVCDAAGTTSNWPYLYGTVTYYTS